MNETELKHRVEKWHKPYTMNSISRDDLIMSGLMTSDEAMNLSEERMQIIANFMSMDSMEFWAKLRKVLPDALAHIPSNEFLKLLKEEDNE